MIYLVDRKFFNDRFLPAFSPQGHHIVHNLGPVFRVFVPMILYFVIMWSSAFALVYYLTKHEKREERLWGYEMAVVQSFTA